MWFLIGVAVGAVALKAYYEGAFRRLLGFDTEPIQQKVQSTAQQISNAAPTEQIRQAASAAQQKLTRTPPSPLVMPSAAEIATRPSEPLLPREEPESVQLENR